MFYSFVLFVNFLVHALISFLGGHLPDYPIPKAPSLQDYRKQLIQLSELKYTIRNSIKNLEKVGKQFKLKLNIKPAGQVTLNI